MVGVLEACGGGCGQLEYNEQTPIYWPSAVLMMFISGLELIEVSILPQAVLINVYSSRSYQVSSAHNPLTENTCQVVNLFLHLDH